MEKKSNNQGAVKEIKKLIITLGILIVLLGAFIITLTWPLISGQTIVLATTPVDPFDPFRGQYLVINYEISVIPFITGAESGDDIFVILNKDETGVYRYNTTSLNKPQNGIFIKGTIKSIYGNNINVKYGIEQYFFEKNAELPTQNITVEAKVAGSGQARIVQLLQNGDPIKIKYVSNGIKT